MPLSNSVRSKSASALADTEEEPSPQSLRGRRVGNFVVARRLGSGGMAVVYEARHPALGRKVAIKLLRHNLSENAATRARFLQEARLLAGLHHPNIVKVFDLGEVAERAYYVMELLEGATLADLLIERGRLPPHEAGELLVQVAAGLAAAHAQEIVHRDLKPENVFVVAGQRPCCKLMDFGIAKAETAEVNLEAVTQAGQILGTPTHLAPEQALGQAALVGPRTDLYALGVIAFELLSGTLPFAADSAVEMVIQHVRDPAPPLGERVPGLPAELCALVDQCLAKEPSKRPNSAEAFAQALKRALPPHSVPPSGPNPLLGADCQARVSGPPRSAPETGDPSAEAADGPRSQGRKANDPAAPKRPTAVRTATSPRPRTANEPSEEPSATPPPRQRSPMHEAGAPDDGLDRLLQRIQKRPDFPSFPANVSEISRKADADNEFCAGELSQVILKDLALTATLVRMVNTLFMNRFSGRVHSVNQAVVILGFDRVRTIAMSASVFKLPSGQQGPKRARGKSPASSTRHHQVLIDSTVSSLVSGELARQLAAPAGVEDSELAMMCAMFRNLGRQLVMQYLPADYSEVQRLVASGLTERQAALRALGTSFSQISFGVAERWKLPLVLRHAMSHDPDPKQTPISQKERLSALSQLANALCQTVMQSEGAGSTACLEPVLARYESLLVLGTGEISGILGTICKSFEQQYRASLGVHSRHNRFVKNARSLRGDAAASEAPRNPGPPQPVEIEKILHLVQDAEACLRQRTDAAPLLTQCLEATRSFLATPRALLLRQDPQTKALVIAAGAGADVEALAKRFCVPPGTNLFSSTLRTGRSARIEDTLSPGVMRSMPRAYYEAIGSPALVLYPCTARGYPSVLLLIDCDDSRLLPHKQREEAIKPLRGLIARLTERLERSS